MSDVEIEGPRPEDLRRMSELVAAYSDLPLGGTKASVIALAERLDARTVVSFDHRLFTVVRPDHCESLSLLP